MDSSLPAVVQNDLLFPILDTPTNLKGCGVSGCRKICVNQHHFIYVAGECSCRHTGEIGRSLIVFCHTCCYIPLAQLFAALYNPEGTARLTP